MLLETPLLAAVASPRRREILRLIWRDELAAGEISRAMPDVTFGAVSLQLRALVDAGLVESRPEGRHRLYRARPDKLGPVGQMLEGMWSDALWRLKLQAELVQTRRGPGAARVKAPAFALRASASGRSRGGGGRLATPRKREQTS
jgi:DNA-binding transcriptional ArsR family regulator